MSDRLYLGTAHRCEKCGYEVQLGAGHKTDYAVCIACGADFVVDYGEFMFAHCTDETPGTLIWFNSEALKIDDRDNPVEVRSGVLPIKGSDLPDLSSDVCPKCKSAGTLRLALEKVCSCPKCQSGVLREVGAWIQ